MFCTLVSLATFAQTVTLTFTAKDAGNHHVQLNRVAITNLSKSWQETIFWPDTVLIMQNGTGVEDYIESDGFALSQNNPNPFSKTTDVSLTVAEAGAVTLEISDVNGHTVETQNLASTQPGIHQFHITLSTAGTYIMTARQNGQTSSIKMVCYGGGGANTIDYLGMVQTITYVLKSSTNNPFNFGDIMEYVGYATINGTEVESQRITQAQGASQTFTLQFAETQHQVPSVITNAVSDITPFSAIVGGTVTNDGGVVVFDRGVCYSTVPMPTVSNDCIHIGQGTGVFSDYLTGLTANTTYYVRAYAMNSVGKAYGNEVTFITTTAAQLPTVVTTAASDITQTTAICGGNVVSDGGASVTARGVCWSTSQNPTIASSHTTDGTGTGSFTSYLTGLTAGVTYYVRTYATNSVGIVYGNEVSFTTTTTAAQLPTVVTTSASDITQTTATCGGNVVSDGGASVTARGVCWSTSQNPTIASSHTTDGSGPGSFTSYLTGLTASTTYYVRAYATNSVGIAYGNEVSFTTTTTAAQLPTVVTTSASNITQTTATCGGNVVSDGGASVTARGVCWSTSQNPTIAGNHTTDGSGIGSFTSSLTGLTSGTTYYVRAYATNSVGTVYGDEVYFTTTQSTPAVDGQPCSGTPTVTDYDGNVYNTVKIGNQCWMKENMKTTHYADGTEILAGGNAESFTTAYHYTPNGTTDYGRLYNWAAVMYGDTSSASNPSNVRGICPIGWHVPSNAEWSQLTQYVGYNSPTALNVLLAGFFSCHSLSNSGYMAYFWSASEANCDRAFCRYMYYSSTGVYSGNEIKGDGYSVRCLRDESNPSVTTFKASAVSETSATINGSIMNPYNVPITIRGFEWKLMNGGIYTPVIVSGNMMTYTLMGLTANTSYTYRAFVSYGETTVYGDEVTFMTPSASIPCPGTPTVTDYDGNIYNTVKIGNQCWMKENLRTTHYADGTTIITDNYCSSTEAYYDAPVSSSIYGYLYNWKAVMHNSSSSPANPSGVQGVCPTGWHVPSNVEWSQLAEYVSSQSDWCCSNNTTYIAKALASNTCWITSTTTCAIGNDLSTNNATGFNALPVYYEDIYSGELLFSYGSYFWSATEDYSESGSALCHILYYSSPLLDITGAGKISRLYVRCLRDESNLSVTTFEVSDVSVTYATINGNITNPDNVPITAKGFEWKITNGGTYTQVMVNDNIMAYTLTGLTASTSYTYRAFVTYGGITLYGDVVTFETLPTSALGGSQPCPSAPTVTDYDGNVYNTVKIGNQCWMKENLRTTHFANGDPIYTSDTTSMTIPYYYNYYAYNTAHGHSYNWSAVMHGNSSSDQNPSSVQGICPTGWHVPSRAEWVQLRTYVINEWYDYWCSPEGIARLLADTAGWISGSDPCDIGDDYLYDDYYNITGFSALPAGYFWYGVLIGSEPNLYIDWFGYRAIFWSSTVFVGEEYEGGYYYDGTTTAYCFWLNNDEENVIIGFGPKDYGMSVRCVKNDNNVGQTVPSVTTNNVTINSSTVTCGGTVTSDGGATITARGVCWSTSQNPTIAGNYTTDGSGTGSFTSSLTGLTAGTTYYVRAYATNSVGTAYGNEVSFTLQTTPAQFTCGSSSISDIDGNVYNTVQLGNQCWMKENLRTTTYADGTSIPEGSSVSSTTGYWYYPNNDATNKLTHGLLYNWAAVMRNVSSSSTNPSGVQGVCPNGWHVPSDAEWTQLTNYVSSQSQYVCGSENTYIAKALASTTGWNNSATTCAVGNTPGGNNATGFSTLPAGAYNGSYSVFGNYANLWSTTEGTSGAYIRFMGSNLTSVGRGLSMKTNGYSVRCVYDGSGISQSLPTVDTSEFGDVTLSTATSENRPIVSDRIVCRSVLQDATMGEKASVSILVSNKGEVRKDHKGADVIKMKKHRRSRAQSNQNNLR